MGEEELLGLWVGSLGGRLVPVDCQLEALELQLLALLLDRVEEADGVWFLRGKTRGHRISVLALGGQHLVLERVLLG